MALAKCGINIVSHFDWQLIYLQHAVASREEGTAVLQIGRQFSSVCSKRH